MVFVSVAYNVQCTIDIYVSQNEVQGHNMFFLKLKPIVFYSAWHCPLRYTAVHCRLQVPDNTQKFLTEIWQHFWIKNDGEKWSRKIILKFHDGLQTCCCPVQKRSAQKGWIGLATEGHRWIPKYFFLNHFSPSF